MSDDKKADVWMPIWIGAYTADTMDLTTLQHGAYLLLLLNYWRKRAPLPDNDETLRTIVKLERAEWKRNRPTLAAFFRVGDGVWWHKRVEAEIIEADKRAAAAKAKALKGAEGRWGKSPRDATGSAPASASGNATSNAPSMPEALPKDMPKQCPTPSPIPIPTGSSDADASGGEPPDADVTVEPVEVIFGLGVPLLTAAGIAEKQARTFLGLQRKLARSDQRVADAIRQAIDSKALQPLEFIVGVLKTGKVDSSHTGFDSKDYHAGANADGSF